MSASRLLVLAAATLALSACATSREVPVGKADQPRTPTELWRAQVSTQPAEIRLAVRGEGLSAAQSDALAAFAADWRGEGGPIVLRAPVSGPDAALTARSTEAVRGFLLDQGVSNAEVSVMGYDAKGDRAAPLVLTRQQYSVTVPECGREWTNLAHSWKNEVQPNFGCAITANMAAQLANPADLTRPAASTAADVQRREVVLDKYRQGEITATKRDEQANGAVAKAGN